MKSQRTELGQIVRYASRILCAYSAHTVSIVRVCSEGNEWARGSGKSVIRSPVTPSVAKPAVPNNQARKEIIIGILYIKSMNFISLGSMLLILNSFLRFYRFSLVLQFLMLFHTFRILI